jgi:hypothetical protein
MASAVVQHLLHPLTCEGGIQIAKKHFLYSLGITFAEIVFASWAAWPNSWSSNYPAALFIGTFTVITFYACTALFKTYVYTGNNTSQGSADAGRSYERGEVTLEKREKTADFNQLIAQIRTEISELRKEIKTYLAKVKEDLIPKSQPTGSVEPSKIGNANPLSMTHPELVVILDERLDRVKKQVVEIQNILRANSAS